MSSRRAKIAATATVLGLGGLAGVALESNNGLPVTAMQTRGASGSIVTSTSGAAAVPASQTGAAGEAAGTRAAIVTRASGGLSAAGVELHDD